MGSWEIIVLPQSHGSLIFCVPWSLALLSSHLKKSLLISFGREILSPVSPSRNAEAFSDLFYKCTWSTLPIPYWQGSGGWGWAFLRLYAFPLSCKTRPGVDSLSPYPSGGSWKSCRILLAFCACSLAVCKDSLLLSTGVHTGSPAMVAWEQDVGEVCRPRGVPMRQSLREIWRGGISSSTSLKSSEVAAAISSLSKSFITDHLTYLSEVRNKWASWAASCSAVEVRHSLSLFPTGGITDH